MIFSVDRAGRPHAAPANRPVRIGAHGAAVLCVLASLLWGSAACLAQEEAGSPAPSAAAPETRDASVDPLVLGVVEGPDGAPVAGARLWLVGGSYSAPETLGETVSQEDGSFAFTDLSDEEAAGQLNVWARRDGVGVGWFNGLYNHKRKPLTVRLRETADFRGRLADADGQPIAGAAVTPTILYSTRLGGSDMSYSKLTDDVLPDGPIKTDANGEFAVRGLPSAGSMTARVSADSLGEFSIAWNLGASVTTRLPSPGSIRGRVEWPEGVDLSNLPDEDRLGTVRLYSHARYDADGAETTEAAETAYRVNFSDELPLASDGRFACEHAPAGEYRASLVTSPHAPALAGEPVTFTVAPSQSVTDVSLQTERAVRITGRVLSVTDRRPVAGATVHLNYIREGRLIHGNRATTDDDGAYVIHAAEGTARIEVVEAPERHVPLDAYYGSNDTAKERIPTLELKEDTAWPDLLLDPAGDVEMIVVDDRGDPVPGADVRIEAPGRFRDFQWGKGQTLAGGRYTIRRVALNDTLPIRVRTPQAISAPGLVITPGQLDGPLRVTLSDEHGFRFRCKVVDEQGAPIEDANVSIGTSYPYVSKWIDPGLSRGGTAGVFHTDSAGAVVTGPLWPDMGYRVSAAAEGYGEAEAPYTRGDKGDVVELPTFVLPRARPPVAGVVVDTEGEPLAGARVFAAGAKSWRPASQLTNPAGEFRLEETAPAVRYVFADAQGHRLGGARLSRDDAPVTITLRPNDAPPRGVEPPTQPLPEERHSLATPLILDAWDMISHPRTTARLGPLEAMCRVDADMAEVMSTLAGGTFTYVVHAERAEQAFTDDPGHALELLTKSSTSRRINTMLEWGEQLARTGRPEDKQRALALAESAAALAGEHDPPSHFPKVARLLTRLGDHDQARSLALRTLETFGEEGPATREEWLYQQTAAALAPYDLQRALAMLDVFEEPFQHSRAVGRVALALLPVDPDKAIEVVESITGDVNASTVRDRSRLKIAMELAPTDVDKAVALVQQCERPAHRAQALGHVAVRVAEVDKERAWDLIDEALAIHRSDENAFQSWTNYGEGGPFAALLAYQAKQADYPDMESVVWHALAAGRAIGDVTSGQHRLKATIKTARILALVDQATARQLLVLIEEQQDQLPRGDGGISLFDQWVQAWLLVDFQRGVELLKADLERLKESDEEDPLRYGHGDVLRLLTAAPGERIDLVIEDTGLWRLDEE